MKSLKFYNLHYYKQKMETNQTCEYCPICYKLLPLLEIDSHVNKCIFLNSVDEHKPGPKRKRSSSPPKFENKHKSFSTSESSSTDKHADPNTNFIPLPAQMQPKRLDDFYGQDQIFGRNTFLRSLLDNDEIPSVILWGPPGCGKTSLGNIIYEICKQNPHVYRYTSISAVDCGIREIQNIINAQDEAPNQKTVLFIDEIHRLNKRQQNTLLVQITKGNIIVIGATTENPSFIVSDTFLNHCKAVVMEKLESCHIISIIKKALASLNISIIDDRNTIRNFFKNNQDDLRIQESAVKWLAETTDGDARIALNNLQLILQHNTGNKLLTVANIKNGIKKSHLMYDRDGEEHHNIISAMHESIKGYNENATLYWTARMLVGGEDPLFVARRLIRTSSEDTGNADPIALRLAVSTMHGCQMLGMPENEILVAQCAVYLARAPTNYQIKSALALSKQIITESKGQQPAVPMHLRDMPVKLLKELGYDKSLQRKGSFMPVGLESVNFL